MLPTRGSRLSFIVDSTIAFDQSVTGFELLFAVRERARAIEFGARTESWLTKMTPSRLLEGSERDELADAVSYTSNKSNTPHRPFSDKNLDRKFQVVHIARIKQKVGSSGAETEETRCSISSLNL